MLWYQNNAPRIWRCAQSDFYRDELLNAIDRYTDAVLARIAHEGFNGIWLNGPLYDLMRSSVFEQLNRPRASERINVLLALIDRAAAHGIGVWLYFNDPVGVPVDHPFWQTHPELKGVEKWNQYALCTSTPQVQAFFRDAVESVLTRLPGLAGVFLITACESLTHCWSKRNTRRGDDPPECPRCRTRQPATIVLELLQTWADVSRQMPQPPRVIAWNWEWAYWYPDPQAPITAHLPTGIELLLDMEIGGTRTWRGRPNDIGEYSLSYVGPSQRLIATHAAVADRDIPVHAKLQINNTHELCSIPNIPVISHLHGKFKAMTELGLSGFLGCWNIGSLFTLNSFAMKLYMSDPPRFTDESAFLEQLARDYFDVTDVTAVTRAWRAFGQAMRNYPFSVNMVYFGPHNDAPARPLSLRFEGAPTGCSWKTPLIGDDLSKCLEASRHNDQNFEVSEVIDAYAEMAETWQTALMDYETALSEPGDGLTSQRREQELSCARMIAIQLRCICNQFRFHRRRLQVIAEQALTPPCDLPADDQLIAIMRDEIDTTKQALPLVEADQRLGWHQEHQGYHYDAATIQRKINVMQTEVQSVRIEHVRSELNG